MKSSVFPEDWEPVPMPSAPTGFTLGSQVGREPLLSEPALLAAVTYPWDLQDMFAISSIFSHICKGSLRNTSP